jgi:hypothetical protein
MNYVAISDMTVGNSMSKLPIREVPDESRAKPKGAPESIPHRDPGLKDLDASLASAINDITRKISLSLGGS